VSKYQDVEAKELGKAFDPKQYVVVDVRTDEEYREGHIPGAKHIPYDEMENRFHELENVKEKPILLVCRSGRRSVIAANVLSEKGFNHLFNLKGGMLEWNGPVSKE